MNKFEIPKSLNSKCKVIIDDELRRLYPIIISKQEQDDLRSEYSVELQDHINITYSLEDHYEKTNYKDDFEKDFVAIIEHIQNNKSIDTFESSNYENRTKIIALRLDGTGAYVDTWDLDPEQALEVVTYMEEGEVESSNELSDYIKDASDEEWGDSDVIISGVCHAKVSAIELNENDIADYFRDRTVQYDKYEENIGEWSVSGGEVCEVAIEDNYPEAKAHLVNVEKGHFGCIFIEVPDVLLSAWKSGERSIEDDVDFSYLSYDSCGLDFDITNGAYINLEFDPFDPELESRYLTLFGCNADEVATREIECQGWFSQGGVAFFGLEDVSHYNHSDHVDWNSDDVPIVE